MLCTVQTFAGLPFMSFTDLKYIFQKCEDIHKNLFFLYLGYRLWQPNSPKYFVYVKATMNYARRQNLMRNRKGGWGPKRRGPFKHWPCPASKINPSLSHLWVFIHQHLNPWHGSSNLSKLSPEPSPPVVKYSMFDWYFAAAQISCTANVKAIDKTIWRRIKTAHVWSSWYSTSLQSYFNLVRFSNWLDSHRVGWGTWLTSIILQTHSAPYQCPAVHFKLQVFRFNCLNCQMIWPQIKCWTNRTGVLLLIVGWSDPKCRREKGGWVSQLLDEAYFTHLSLDSTLPCPEHSPWKYDNEGSRSTPWSE